MAKLRKDANNKKSSLDGIQARGGTHKPKTIEKKMNSSLKNNGKSGKKI